MTFVHFPTFPCTPPLYPLLAFCPSNQHRPVTPVPCLISLSCSFLSDPVFIMPQHSSVWYCVCLCHVRSSSTCPQAVFVSFCLPLSFGFIKPLSFSHASMCVCIPERNYFKCGFVDMLTPEKSDSDSLFYFNINCGFTGRGSEKFSNRWTD